MKLNIKKPQPKSAPPAILFAAGFVSALSVTVIIGALLISKEISANMFAINTDESGLTSEIPLDMVPPDDATVDFEAGVQEYKSMENIDYIEKNIAEIESAESELMHKLLSMDPNSDDYWNLRNHLAELKMKKEKLRQMKNSIHTQLKEGKMEILEKKNEVIQTQISDRKAIFEKCRQLGPENFAGCLRDNLGRTGMPPKPTSIQGSFQQQPWPGQQNQGGGQAFPVPQMAQSNPAQGGMKMIIATCKEQSPQDISACIKESVEQMKQNILHEAQKRIEMLQKEAESFHGSVPENGDVGETPYPMASGYPMPSEAWYPGTQKTDDYWKNQNGDNTFHATPPPYFHPSASTYPTASIRPTEPPKEYYQKFYPTERGFIQASPLPYHTPSVTPGTTDAPKTEQQWREYNRQFNSKPTI